MADRIDIEGLTTRAIIGVNDYEREQKQDVILDLTLFTDIAAAARSDNISDTVDYKAVTKRVLRLVEESSFELIETLIEHVAGVILTEFNVEGVSVRIQKPHALRFSRTVAISITRSRNPA